MTVHVCKTCGDEFDCDTDCGCGEPQILDECESHKDMVGA